MSVSGPVMCRGSATAVDVCPPRGDDRWVEFAPGVIAHVITGPFAGLDVVVIEPARSNVVSTPIELVDSGAARLDFPVHDVVVGPAGPEDAAVCEARGTAVVGVLTQCPR